MIDELMSNINTITRNSLIPKKYFISKSGFMLKNFEDKLIFIGGFSTNNNNKLSQKLSQYEVLERYYTHYGDHSNKKFKLINFFSSKQVGELKLEDSLIGPLPNGKMSKKDSNGVAFHLDARKADRNAILEIIERHILYELWYGNLKFIKIRKDKKLQVDVVQSWYTCFLPNLIPFVVTILKIDGVLIFGSSVKSSYKEAIEKSSGEAYMILDGILRKDKGMSNSNRSKRKLLSLQDVKLAKKRGKYIEDKTIDKKIQINIKQVYSVGEIINNLEWDEYNVKIARLYESKKGTVSRAIIGNAKSVLSVDSSDKKIPDPFS